MYIPPLTEIDNVPSLGAMIGNLHSSSVLDEINAKWSDNAVAFGLPSNPFGEGYKNFMQIVDHQINVTDKMVMQTTSAVYNPHTYRVVTDEDGLALMPPVMQPTILMMPVVCDLFRERKIWGWNWNPDSFPESDQFGRLISNGKAEWDPRDPSTCPEYLTWEFEQDDTQITDEMLEAVEKTRRWLSDWLEHEMNEGTRRDPTDLSNVISV